MLRPIGPVGMVSDIRTLWRRRHDGAQANRTPEEKNGALIFFGQERGVFACALRDIDDVEIGLQVNDPDAISETFTHYIG
jgi:hypothetical protein